MKTSTLPAVRVTPEVRELAESVLKKGETLSMFIEDSLRKETEFRKTQNEFIARGIASGIEARQTGIYVTAQDSLARLRSMQSTKRKSMRKAA